MWKAEYHTILMYLIVQDDLFETISNRRIKSCIILMSVLKQNIVVQLIDITAGWLIILFSARLWHKQVIGLYHHAQSSPLCN